MVNEHVLMTQKTFPISMTVDNAAAIEKGTVLVGSDPNTAAANAHDAEEELVCGVSYTEKIANDGNTQIAVLSGPGDELRGIASGSILYGDPLVTAKAATANYLASISGSRGISGSRVIGYSKERAEAGNTFKYVLNIESSTFA